MSILEPLAEDVARAMHSYISEYVISREESPTDVATSVFFGSKLGYTLGVIITHDGFSKKYIYETYHTSPKELVKDKVLSDKLFTDITQFAIDYFQHCLKERTYEIQTKR